MPLIAHKDAIYSIWQFKSDPSEFLYFVQFSQLNESVLALHFLLKWTKERKNSGMITRPEREPHRTYVLSRRCLRCASRYLLGSSAGPSTNGCTGAKGISRCAAGALNNNGLLRCAPLSSEALANGALASGAPPIVLVPDVAVPTGWMFIELADSALVATEGVWIGTATAEGCKPATDCCEPVGDRSVLPTVPLVEIPLLCTIATLSEREFTEGSMKLEMELDGKVSGLKRLCACSAMTFRSPSPKDTGSLMSGSSDGSLLSPHHDEKPDESPERRHG